MTKNKIRELRKQKNVTQKELASFLQIADSTLSYWEMGKYEPDNESLKKLSNYFSVPIDFLLGHSSKSNPQILSSDTPRKKGIKIPVLGTIAAGIPIEAIEDIVDWEEITEELAHTGEFFGLIIKGDSMEPVLQNGDVVIVRKQSHAETGDTVAVLINGEDATVKRIKKESDGVILIPNNPTYEPMYYSPQQVEELPLSILGKVIELRRKF